MKLPLLFLLLLNGVTCFGQSTENKKIENLHNLKFRWMIEKNYDSLTWVTDASLKFIHSNAWVQTRKDFIDDLKSGKLNYTSIEVEEISTTVYNNQTGVITGKGTFRGLMPDKTEFNIHLLYTETYVRLKNEWKLVLRQACKIP